LIIFFLSLFIILIQAKYTYQNNMMTKWLLAVTLIVNIFSISGYSDHYQSRLQKATKTELVISNHRKLGKRTVSYKKAVENISFLAPLNSLYKSRKYQLSTHNTLTKVKLDNILRQYYTQKPDYPFLRPKTIPTSSDEDIFVSYIG